MTVQGHGWDDNTGFPAFRNMVINGGFDVWQRGTSFTAASLTSPYYTADRWITVRGGLAAGATWSRQTSDLTGFNYFMRCQRDNANTGTANVHASTTFETINIKRLQGKVLTLSFWARAGANYSSASSALKAQIAVGTGTDSNYLMTGFTSGSLLLDSTVTLTTSWQRFTLTTSSALLTTHNQLGINFFNTPVGTAGANDYFDITGVQLEAGSVASPFEFEPFETTLRKCMRYYEKSYRQDVNPGTNQSSFPTIVQEVPFITGFTQTDGWGLARILFTVPKRTGPTVTLYNESGTINTATQIIGTTASTLTNPTIAGNDKGFMFQGGVAAGGSAVKIVYHYTANAEL